MKTKATVRRWIRDLKAEDVHSNMEVYRQGAIMALQCLTYDDWPAPVKFLQVGKKVVVRYGEKAKLIRRAAQAEPK